MNGKNHVPKKLPKNRNKKPLKMDQNFFLKGSHHNPPDRGVIRTP
jgi:hypothetical protein